MIPLVLFSKPHLRGTKCATTKQLNKIYFNGELRLLGWCYKLLSR
jgi:hypothetical protein